MTGTLILVERYGGQEKASAVRRRRRREIARPRPELDRAPEAALPERDQEEGGQGKTQNTSQTKTPRTGRKEHPDEQNARL